MTAAVDPDTAIVQYEGTHRTSQYTLYLVLFSDSLQKWIETEKRLSMKKNLDVSDSSGVTHGNIYAWQAIDIQKGAWKRDKSLQICNLP